MTEQQRGVRHPADDVEGHASTFRGVSDQPAQDDDVEGHRWKGGVADEPAQDDDVEGHASRFGGVTDELAQDDDIEGTASGSASDASAGVLAAGRLAVAATDGSRIVRSVRLSPCGRQAPARRCPVRARRASTDSSSGVASGRASTASAKS